MEKQIIGRTEEVTIIAKGKEYKLKARIDTGTYYTSVDEDLFAKLKLGPVVGFKRFRTALSSKGERRPMVKLTYVLAGQRIDTIASIAKRKHMRYPMIIGRRDLKGRFLIDPSKA